MRIVDKGHTFMLDELDGETYTEQGLRFVKRSDYDAYRGTTNEEVCRVLISRLQYLDDQLPWWGNGLCIQMLRAIVWLHEYRTNLRRGKRWFNFPPFKEIENVPVCRECGHLHEKKHWHGYRTRVGYWCEYCERKHAQEEQPQ